MNILLKQISDANSGKCELRLNAHVPFLPGMFACPMISMSYLDCISETHISEIMMAKQEFESTSFYLTNCFPRTHGDMSRIDVARTCPRFQNGSACWDELTAELLRRKQR